MIGIPLPLALTHVVHSATRVDGANGGALFTLDPSGAVLGAEAHLGLPDEIALHMREIPVGDGTATGNAVLERRRVVIRDVAGDNFGEHTDALLALGISAITATPVFGDRRRVLGVLTLFYGEPHHPTPPSLRQIDLCCAIAAHLIELQRASGIARPPSTVKDASRRSGAEAVRVLLPACAEQMTCDEAVLMTLERHLNQLLKNDPGGLRDRPSGW